MHSTRWHTNQFIRGAYSYISTDCDTNDEASAILSKPLTLKDFDHVCPLSVKKTNTRLDLTNPKEDKDLLTNDKKKSKRVQNHPNKVMCSGNSTASSKIKSNGICSCHNYLDEMPIVLFAGEACHDQYFSTAHGAFLSGTEQAAKVLNFYKF